MNAEEALDSGRRRLLTGKLLTERVAPSSGFGVSILECAVREADEDGVLWIDYALENRGSERTNVFVYLRKEQPKRSVKVLRLDPDEVFRGSCRELGKKQAEQMFLEVEATSGTNSQREVLRVQNASSVKPPREEET